jgi:hypothetical protein
LPGLLGGWLLGRLMRRRRDKCATIWAVGALGFVFKFKAAERAFNLNHAPLYITRFNKAFGDRI